MALRKANSEVRNGNYLAGPSAIRNTESALMSSQKECPLNLNGMGLLQGTVPSFGGMRMALQISS